MSLSTLITVGFTATGLLVGYAIARMTGCGQCRDVRDQEIELVGQMLGRSDVRPLRRHALRRNRPFTCAETLQLLDCNDMLPTPAFWERIDAQRDTWTYRKLRRGRAITASPDQAGVR